MATNRIKNYMSFYCCSNIKCLYLHLKNQQNFKVIYEWWTYYNRETTLKERIEALPEDSVLFRSDFLSITPSLWEYLVWIDKYRSTAKISQGIYVKPRNSRFGLYFHQLKELFRLLLFVITQLLPSEWRLWIHWGFLLKYLWIIPI